jgi:hypothetical protein
MHVPFVSNFVALAQKRLLAAYITPMPAIDSSIMLLIAVFALVVVPYGLYTKALALQVEKRPTVILKVHVLHTRVARADATRPNTPPIPHATALLHSRTHTHSHARTSPRTPQTLVIVFLLRGLAEEAVFRVAALPHPLVDGRTSPRDFAVKCVDMCQRPRLVTGHSVPRLAKTPSTRFIHPCLPSKLEPNRTDRLAKPQH